MASQAWMYICTKLHWWAVEQRNTCLQIVYIYILYIYILYIYILYIYYIKLYKATTLYWALYFWEIIHALDYFTYLYIYIYSLIWHTVTYRDCCISSTCVARTNRCTSWPSLCHLSPGSSMVSPFNQAKNAFNGLNKLFYSPFNKSQK